WSSTPRSWAASAWSSTCSAPWWIPESGCRTTRTLLKTRLGDWIPRHSIVGRIVHPLFEERKSLAGRMSWIGLFILIAFLIVALGADVIAPFDPILLVDAKYIPPWTVVVIPRNETFTGWQGYWTSVSLAQSVTGLGAVSNRTLEVETLRSVALDVKRDAVVSVGLNVLLDR